MHGIMIFRWCEYRVPFSNVWAIAGAVQCMMEGNVGLDGRIKLNSLFNVPKTWQQTSFQHCWPRRQVPICHWCVLSTRGPNSFGSCEWRVKNFWISALQPELDKHKRIAPVAGPMQSIKLVYLPKGKHFMHAMIDPKGISKQLEQDSAWVQHFIATFKHVKEKVWRN